MNVIDIQNLTKRFPLGLFKGGITALDRISIQVAQGEVHGFLGQNGAGKTTTLKIMMGLNRPTSGTLRLFEQAHDDPGVRERIGYLPEQPYFYDYLTAREFMTFYARLFGKTQFDPHSLLVRVGLEGALHKRLRTFSKGMLQRIGIAQALINDPHLLILDEPMSGLDPAGRMLVRNLLTELKAAGKTVFLSSHIISDIEMVCDRVTILHRGKIKAAGKITDLLRGAAILSVMTLSGLRPESVDILKLRGLVVSEGTEGLSVELFSDEEVAVVLEIARQQGGRLVSLVPMKRSLESFFMEKIAEPE